MQTHRFALGEFVAFTEKRFPGLIWAAEWEIIDLLEPADGTPRYRIRGRDGVSNEVISETELGVPVADRREHPAAYRKPLTSRRRAEKAQYKRWQGRTTSGAYA